MILIDTPCMAYMPTLTSKTTTTDRQIWQSHGVFGCVVDGLMCVFGHVDMCRCLSSSFSFLKLVSTMLMEPTQDWHMLKKQLTTAYPTICSTVPDVYAALVVIMGHTFLLWEKLAKARS